MLTALPKAGYDIVPHVTAFNHLGYAFKAMVQLAIMNQKFELSPMLLDEKLEDPWREFDMLIFAYVALLPKLGGYLTDAGRVHLPRTEVLLREVSAYEGTEFTRAQ